MRVEEGGEEGQVNTDYMMHISAGYVRIQTKN